MSSDFTQNYFELFGLPVVFSLDQNDLLERYRKLQRATHPDRFANAPEHERRLSVQKAALVNQAYEQLKSPLLRGRYMLELWGVEFDDQRETQFDPAFLMEQMEYREELDAAQSSDDALDRLTDLESRVGKRRQELIDELASLLNTGSGEALQTGKQCVRKLQFLQKLQHEIVLLEEELFE